MKLHKLEVGQVFYWKGKKYTIMLKLKKTPKKAYTIPCWEHPMPNGGINMPSNREVKSVIKIKALNCDLCNGAGEILQDDGSDSTGTLINCEHCNGS